MEVLASGWHLVSATIIFVAGGLLALPAGRRFGVPDMQSVSLYLWHTVFSMAYLAYSLDNPADSKRFFERSLVYTDGFGVGSQFVYFFSSLFTKFLGMSYLGVFLVFNTLGYFGLLAFCGALRTATVDKSRHLQRLGLFLVFLPSVSFWSSAIGKDAISFMAAALALWAALDMNRRVWLLGVAISAMLLVRPHIAALMVAAGVVSVMCGPRMSMLRRVLVGAAALGGAAVVVPLAIGYSGMGEASSTLDVEEYVERRQRYNQEGGTSIDIAEMSLPMQLFSYLFRPLPLEANSITTLAASVDNTVLLGLALLGGLQILRGRRQQLGGNRLFLWVYALSAWVLLARTTANLGISTRQKWMFAPILIYLCLSVIGKVRPPGAARGALRPEVAHLAWRQGRSARHP